MATETRRELLQPQAGRLLPQGNWPQVEGPLAAPSSTGTGSGFCLLTAWWEPRWTSCQPLGRGSAVALCHLSLALALVAASLLAHLWDHRPQRISPLAFTKAVSCRLQARRAGRRPQQRSLTSLAGTGFSLESLGCVAPGPSGFHHDTQPQSCPHGLISKA